MEQDPKDGGFTNDAREEKRTVTETTQVTPAPVTQEETRTVTEESKSTVAPPTPQ